MASTKAYLDYISEQLAGLDDVRIRPMMGEYLLYYRDRLAGGIYDDRLLVQPVPAALKMMPGAPKPGMYISITSSTMPTSMRISSGMFASSSATRLPMGVPPFSLAGRSPGPAGFP